MQNLQKKTGIKEDSTNKKRLFQARKKTKVGEAAQMAKTAKNLAKSATPMGAMSLTKNISLMFDIPYFLALGAAVLKDILDLIGVGSLPAVGTVITICISIFIGLMMLLAGANATKKIAQNMMKRYGVLIGGTICEVLFGLNYFPIETFTVILIYWIVLAERKEA